jgi:hypothetical protein
MAQRKDLFRKKAFEDLKNAEIEGSHGDYLDHGDIVDLLWMAYEQGYQDRIDDYYCSEDTTAEDEFNRTR